LGGTGKQTDTKYFWRKKEAQEWIKKQEAELPAPTQPKMERRKDTLTRERVQQMIKEGRTSEVEDIIFTDGLTGLKNQRGWKAEKRKKHQGMADADGLKFLNDNVSDAAGDSMLKLIGKAFKQATDSVAREHGDEFRYEADTAKELKRIKKEVDKHLLDNPIRVVMPDGEVRYYRGKVTHGRGSTEEAAGLRMHETKKKRVVGRGEEIERVGKPRPEVKPKPKPSVRPTGPVVEGELRPRGEGVPGEKVPGKGEREKIKPEFTATTPKTYENYGLYWNEKLKLGRKVELAKDAGWVTTTGKLTKTGEKIAQSKWEDLSSAAKNVLTRRIKELYDKPIRETTVKSEEGGTPPKIKEKKPGFIAATQEQTTKAETLVEKSGFKFVGTMEGKDSPSVLFNDPKTTHGSTMSIPLSRLTKKTLVVEAQKKIEEYREKEESKEVTRAKRRIKTAVKRTLRDEEGEWTHATIRDTPLIKDLIVVGKDGSREIPQMEKGFTKNPDKKNYRTGKIQ
jgi:GGDEF domain-containing protein